MWNKTASRSKLIGTSIDVLTAPVPAWKTNDRSRCIAAGALANLIQQLHQGSRLDLIGLYLSGQVSVFTPENIFERNLLATLLKVCRAELADEQSALATGCLAECGHSLLGSG